MAGGQVMRSVIGDVQGLRVRSRSTRSSHDPSHVPVYPNGGRSTGRRGGKPRPLPIVARMNQTRYNKHHSRSPIFMLVSGLDGPWASLRNSFSRLNQWITIGSSSRAPIHRYLSAKRAKPECYNRKVRGDLRDFGVLELTEHHEDRYRIR